jgi:hypothetical protein
MADIDYSKLLGELKNAVLVPVTERAGKFLDDNKDAKEFLEERATRLAELGVDLAKAIGDETASRQVVEQIEVVKQTIQNQLSTIAVKASLESKDLFGKILGTAVDVIVKALPAILAAI